MPQTNGQQVLGTHEQPARAYNWGTDSEVLYKQATDPAAKVAGMPPNMGEMVLPQVVTFQGILSSVSRVYRPSDEALKHSFDNARFMLNDLVVTECIDQRRRSVCLLNWHIEPEDNSDPKQKQLCADLTAILERIPNFLKYREALSYAIWYGRYGCQHRYRWQKVKGQMRVCVDRWLPINGDKLVFRYDDGTNDYDPDQIGIRVGAGYQTAHGVQRRWTAEQFNQVQPTDYGLAYFLNEWERSLISVHRYLIEDGEYEDPMNAGRVQGLGIRSRIYWTWYQKQETLAWLTEYLERSSLGMEIWYYPWGNNEGLQSVKAAAEERIGQGRNIVFVPRPMGDNQDAYGMERIEPGMAGAETIERIVKEYFGHLIKRYILGQTMTTEAVPGSLGSGQGDVHLDTYMQIVRYDATNLEETITTDLVGPVKEFNFPWARNVHCRFKIDTEAPDAEKKLAAWKDAYDMGMELKEEGLADLIGAPKAEPGDVVLQNPEAAQGRQVKQGAAQANAATDVRGRSQVSMGGQDFLEMMKILQKQSDERELGAALGAEGDKETRGQGDKGNPGAEGETGEPIAGQLSKYAKKKPAAGQGAIFDRDAGGRFDEHDPHGPRASIADEPFELRNRGRGKTAVADNHDKTRQIKLLDGLDALPGQKDLFQASSTTDDTESTDKNNKDPCPSVVSVVQYASGTADQWITIGAHRGANGEKHGGTPVKIQGGKIVSGPKALKGKTLKGLAKRKPGVELRRAIHKIHKEHGYDKRHIADAIEMVHGERKRLHDEREANKEAIRRATGLTAGDISHVANSGHDYSSAHKMGGATGRKFETFDEAAHNMAREYPGMGLGDPDNPRDNFSENLWNLLAEGKLPSPAKHHDDTLEEATNLLHANAGYLNEPEEEPVPFAAAPEDGERHRLDTPDRPLNDAPAIGGDGAGLLGLLNAAFQRRGYVARYAKEFDESNVKRDAKGEFAKKPGSAGADAKKKESSTAAEKYHPSGRITARSKARVHVAPEHLEQVTSLSNELGAPLADIPSLIGAPDDAEVTITPAHHDLMAHVKHPAFEMKRMFFRDEQGDKALENVGFHVADDQQRNGIATRIFARQAYHAARAGYSQITTAAQRDREHNGHITWAKTGFDQPIGDLDQETQKRVRNWHPQAATVQDIIAAENGADWWETKGGSMKNATFDLRKGSRSRKVLAAYLRRKSRSWRRK